MSKKVLVENDIVDDFGEEEKDIGQAEFEEKKKNFNLNKHV